MPAYLLRGGDMSRTVYTRTTIRDDGKLQSCEAEISSGDPKLDAYTCAIIVKRGKFFPGKGRDGAVIYTVLRFPVNWTITGANPPRVERPIVPDLDLSVNRLPKRAGKLIALALETEVDDQGHIVTCAELPPMKGDRHPHFPELVPTVCQQAVKSLTLRPPQDRSGRATRSIQTVSVRVRADG